jgi:hypothetical protein
MAMSRGYDVRIRGIGQTAETIRIDETDDRHAVLAAFGACSPLGHSLWDGARFLGYFEAGAARISDEAVLVDAFRDAVSRGPHH